MCRISSTYIPEKHKAFWDEHYKDIKMDSGADFSISMLLMRFDYES